MDVNQIIEYWIGSNEELYMYKWSQFNNTRLLKSTMQFLVSCGLPVNCAPGLSFGDYGKTSIPTPNQVFNFNIDIEELNDYLMIGSNDSGDPVCIDLVNENEIVYLNHDNFFERVYMNGSVHQLAECIIRYEQFKASLHPRFENDQFVERKFSNEEFSSVCNSFQAIDHYCLLEGSFWRSELDYMLWERDNG